jgi:3-isopropylmalate dehydrogenase
MDVANPLATIWAGSMLLDHIGEHEAAAAVLRAVERCILDKFVTRDMGGSKKTSEVGRYVASLVKKV